MAPRALRFNDTGDDVLALQQALNRQAEQRFYPPLVADNQFGSKTLRAFQAIGWALGLTQDVLDAPTISVAAQKLIADPDQRAAGPLQRAKSRGPKLNQRTVGFDGAPTYWGLAKPLLLAREHGWGGQLASSDRRQGVAELFGKKSQAALFNCFTRAQALGGRCPADCGGDCAPANAPGASSHEQRSDGSGFPGPVGRMLEWWELGLDVSDSDKLLSALETLGYQAHRTYPSNPKEFHHINFTADPGPVLPSEGPASKPAHTAPPVVVTPPKPKPSVPAGVVTLTGPDVSQNQPDVDWEQVAAAGHTFAIAKVSDGLGTPDPTFGKGRWKAMKQAGLVRGVYHFGRPQKGRDPKLEVAEFLAGLDAAGGLEPGDLVPVLDIEKYGAAGRLTPNQTLEWARVWAAELRMRIGRQPIIYTGAFWRDQMANPADNLGCPLWLAAYVAKSRLPSLIPVAWKTEGLTLWQYTSTGSCPGIAGNCDLSRFDGAQADFDRLRI